MLAARGDIHQLYFAALVGIACLVQPLKQAVNKFEGILVVIEIHIHVSVFSFIHFPQLPTPRRGGGKVGSIILIRREA